MSLERKDVRSKLDPDWHEVLLRVAARDGLDVGEYVEQILLKALKKRLHNHSLDREFFADLTAAGKIGDRRGKH